MTEEAENPSEDVSIPIPGGEQRRRVISHIRTALLLVLLVIVCGIPLIVRLTLRNPGTGDDVNQVHPTSDQQPTPRLTGGCVTVKKMATFNDSAEHCKSRNARLLNEQDMKRAAPCMIRGEDFWAAPVSRGPAGCFIYNTDHGFVGMHCLTARWFICLDSSAAADGELR